jgi:hypothetical protein
MALGELESVLLDDALHKTCGADFPTDGLLVATPGEHDAAYAQFMTEREEWSARSDSAASPSGDA